MTRLGSTDDAGLTLVELLVAMTLMIFLMGVTLTVVKTGQGALNTAQVTQDLNEEARQAINRMARDVRQAAKVVTAVNPDGPAHSTTSLVAVRFQADFNGDRCVAGLNSSGTSSGCLPYDAANPEDLTYCYQPGTAQLFVIDNQASGVTPVTPTTTSCSGGQPLLAGNVASFRVDYRSDQYRFDLNPSDGVTTWREVDEAGTPSGNNNGVLDVELPFVDTVVLNVRMASAGRQQVYRTQVDMRNVSR